MVGDWTDGLRESGEAVRLVDRLRSHLQFSATVAVLVMASAVCMEMKVVRNLIMENVYTNISDHSFLSALLVTLYMVTTLAALAIVLGKMALGIRSYLQSVRLDTALRIYGRLGSASADLVTADEEARRARILLVADFILAMLSMALASVNTIATMVLMAVDVLCFGLLWRSFLRIKNLLITQNI